MSLGRIISYSKGDLVKVKLNKLITLFINLKQKAFHLFCAFKLGLNKFMSVLQIVTAPSDNKAFVFYAMLHFVLKVLMQAGWGENTFNTEQE